MTTKGGEDEFAQLSQSAKRAIVANCSAKREAPQLKETPWFLMKANLAENVKSLLAQLVYDSRRNSEKFAELTAQCLVDLIHKRQRATEIHACFLQEDIEIREHIELHKLSTGPQSSAEIQVLSLSGGDELSVKIGIGREAYTLQGGESIELDNVSLEEEITLEVMSGKTALGKTTYRIAPKEVPSQLLMTKDTLTVKGPLELKGITMMLQTNFKLSMTDRISLLRENLQDLEDKLRLKGEDEHKLDYMMTALDLTLDDDQVFKSSLKKPIAPKDRDCECRLL